MKSCSFQYDVLIAGAGYAGICAAVQAGRLGLRTILIEKNMLLGGNGGPNLGVGATAALTTNAYWHETGIVEELELRTGYWKARTQPTSFGYNIHPQWDCTVAQMLREANVTLLRSHIVINATTENGKIVAVEVLNAENLERKTISAKYYIDDTGDALLAGLAGADCAMGRESKQETGERCAPQHADKMISAASITALVADVGEDAPFIAPKGTPVWNPDKPCNHFDPSKKLHFIWQVDEGGEDETNHSYYTPQELYTRLTYRVYSTWDYLKNSKYKDELKHHALIWISPILGRREGPRILGDYLLTQKDIESGKVFVDASGFGGHFLDEHLPSRDGGYEVRFYNRPIPFDIPLRSLYSRNVENLFSAGRAVGVSHIAFTSVRLMRTGGVLGQAVAIAAKMCIDKNVTPRTIATDMVQEYRAELNKNDVFTIGYYDRFKENLIGGATVTASSEARLDDGIENCVFQSAEDGVGTWLCQYPKQPKQIQVYLKNESKISVCVQLKVWYGETKPTQLYPVPEVNYDEKEKRFIEVSHLDTSLESGEAIPQGKQGFSAYFRRDDTIEPKALLCQSTINVPLEFAGWVTLIIPENCTLKPFDRQISAQALGVKVEGNVLVATRAEPLDVCVSMKQSMNQLLLNVSPDIMLGSPSNVLDGYIHREGRAHTHQWRTRKGEAMPQWIELILKEPVQAKRFTLHFDVTQSNYWQMCYIRNKRGCEFLPKDFEILALQNGEWKSVYRVRDNYLRFVNYESECPICVEGIKIIVHALWDNTQQARLYHVGLYE